MTEPTVEVVPDPARNRFEIHVDGTSVGHTEYVRRADLLIFTHTEIDPAFEGQGLASRLARGALDAVRAAGDPIVALCPFIAGYIERHPEYADLVDAECTEFFEARARRRSAR
jgi:predicted GNAT family acetyltransferase